MKITKFVYGTTALAAIGITQSIFTAYQSVFLADHLAFTKSQSALIISAQTLISLLATLFLTLRTDKHGQSNKTILLLCCIGATSYAVLTIFAKSHTVSVTIIITGIALIGPLTALGFGFIAVEAKTASQNILSRTWYSLAWIFGPVLASLIFQVGSFEALFALNTIILIGAFSIYSRVGRGPKGSFDQLEYPICERHKPFPTKLAILSLLAFVMIQGVMAIPAFFTPLYSISKLGSDVGDVGYLFAVTALIEVIALWLAAKSRAYLPDIFLIIIGITAGCIYFLLFPKTTTFIQLLCVQPFHGVFVAMIVGPGLNWFQNLDKSRPNSLSGLFLISYSIGATLFTPIIGYTIDTASISVAAYTCLIPLVIGTILISVSEVTRLRK